MTLIIVITVSGFMVLFFLVLWLRERRNAQKEYVAYGLRASEDQTENTKTNISAIENGYEEALSRLEDLGEVTRDNWGQWIWTESGKPVGHNSLKK